MVFMSILGRRPSRDDSDHDGSQGRWRDDRDYGDDNWSPDEYFSPQDIRGTRATPSRPERGDRFGDRGPARSRGEADDFDGRGADRARGGDPADSGSFPRAARGQRGVRDGDFGRSGDSGGDRFGQREPRPEAYGQGQRGP